jgi:hypothetical protein
LFYLFDRKFGQSPNKDQHKIVARYDDFENTVCDPENVLKDVKRLDDIGSKLLLIYSNGNENSIENFKTNVVIASFVTMYGRMKLYKLLALVDEHPDCELIYFDTVY